MAYPIDIKIDKGVPRPPKAKYRVKEMQVGDSFFVRGRKQDDMASFRGYYKKKFDYKFEIHTVVENGKRGVRIWRVK